MREQEGEDAGRGAREGEETTHAHHARRPMNAFLIFCKRHRGVVRDKYPNLENRSITKILGEWWANLDEEEKACYTGLAKQYKDAFFSANPDFKWYKLPAPPLRTLAARPSAAAAAERDRGPGDTALPHPHHPRHHTPEPCEPLRTNNNSTKYDFNKRRPRPPSCDEAPLSMFTPGKLADEAHMGGLSSLISSNTDPRDTKPDPYLGYSTPYAPADGDALYTSQYSDRPKHRSKEDSIRELQNALSETTRIFEDLDGKPKEGPEAENFDDRNFTNQEIIDQVIDRGLLKEEHEAREWTEGDRTARSGRSCKGKRYQEFMAVNGLLAGKRSRRDERDGAYAYGAPDWEYPARGDGSHSPEDVDAPLKPEYAASPPPAAEDVAPEPNENESEAKPFRPADFDLDAKIRALPSLSLEKFQEKKRENKRKKKSGFGMKPKESPAARCGGGGGGGAGWPQQRAAAPRAEPWREVVSGSQKRKPRKISITRLEVHSMVNRTGEVKSSPEMKLATEAPRGMEAAAAGVGAAGVPVDLFALATLAEVAASTSKLDEGAPTDARYQYQV